MCHQYIVTESREGTQLRVGLTGELWGDGNVL